tara:strand:+ start:53 stop:244 length:192 start_codon:yes stop_codon:yes gene_type:complete
MMMSTVHARKAFMQGSQPNGPFLFVRVNFVAFNDFPIFNITAHKFGSANGRLFCGTYIKVFFE